MAITVPLTSKVAEGLELRRAQLVADGFEFSIEALVNAALSQYLANSGTYERQRREAMTEAEIAADIEASEVNEPFYPRGHFASHRL